MAKSLAKSFMTESGEALPSRKFSLCVASPTQAHAIVEGKNTENMYSVDERRIWTLKQNKAKKIKIKIKMSKTYLLRHNYDDGVLLQGQNKLNCEKVSKS